MLGADGTRRLADDPVTGVDPLRDFGPNAADHLRRTDGFPHCPDILVNCIYDAEANEVAPFEEFMGSTAGSAAGRCGRSPWCRPSGASPRVRSWA